MSWVERSKPYLAISAVWGGVWGFSGLAVWTLLAKLGVSPLPFAQRLLVSGLGYGLVGVGAGVIFADLLARPHSYLGRYISPWACAGIIGALASGFLFVSSFSLTRLLGGGATIGWVAAIAHLGIGSVCSVASFAFAKRLPVSSKSLLIARAQTELSVREQ